MRRFVAVAALALVAGGGALHAQPVPTPQTVLFVGNSFTFGARTRVEHYRPETVDDLNGTGIGGVPALFRRFADQMGLAYRVAIETEGGKSLRFHYEQRRDRIDRRWDHVLLQDYSTLDPERFGDGRNLRRYAGRIARLLARHNPAIDVRLVATWSRPDLVYGANNRWAGLPIEAMAADVQRAAEQAVEEDPHIRAVIPVGLAFNAAVASGVADGDPLDGIDPGRIDLWADDHYHASVFGYYLEALMDFGSVSGVDPRRLGAGELAAHDLGIAPREAVLLQEIAANTLKSETAAALAPER